MKFKRGSVCAMLVILLYGCGTSAVVTDLEEDKVKVQANGGDIKVIDAEAERGCAMHDRQPQRISYHCLDGYCMQKEYLYACVKN